MKSEIKITKEEHLWTSEMKLKFCGYGEWVEESDVVKFEFQGYQARVIRIFIKEPFTKDECYFGGHLCGYIRIPEDHPYYGKEYQEMDIDAHGGLTFAEVHEQCHWIGYDCGHSCDYIPTMEHMRKNNPSLRKIQEMFPVPEGCEEFALFKPVYRNMQYCINMCIEMIDQLANISVTTKGEIHDTKN